ncbi:MAG: TetR family transcriptional regulator [Actinomycetota bacterium]
MRSPRPVRPPGRAKRQPTREPAGAPPTTDDLSDQQVARRQRVLNAAIDLASEGGYDAVQMRDVATRADVALGTVYRYFSSKDHLLAAAWSAWVRPQEANFAKSPPQGSTMAERALDVLRRVNRGIERRPKLMQALIAAMVSTDAHAQSEVGAVRHTLDNLLVDALNELPAEEERRVGMVLGHVWYSCLVQWVNGRFEMDDVYSSLENACHVVLDWHDR